MCILKSSAVLLIACALATAAPSGGDVTAAEALLERVLGPGGSDHFVLKLVASDPQDPYTFTISDDSSGKVAITAGSVSELTAGLGIYLREVCGMVIGWPRGGGSRVKVPSTWPKVGQTITRRRRVEWSYIMNVCTHRCYEVFADMLIVFQLLPCLVQLGAVGAIH